MYDVIHLMYYSYVTFRYDIRCVIPHLKHTLIDIYVSVSMRLNSVKNEFVVIVLIFYILQVFLNNNGAKI